MGLVTATFGVITNTKIDYECPGCGREVWAYPGFEGTRCWKCPGTILGGTFRSVTGNVPIVSDITDSVTSTVSDTVTDNKKWYTCKSCGKRRWAYGSFVGTKCWGCGGPLTIIDGVGTFTFNSLPGNFRMTHRGPRHLSPPGLKKKSKIYRIKVKNIWIGNGGLSSIGSIISVALTSTTITHWWVEIETYDDKEWYCAQFNNNQELELTRHYSRNGVTKQGKSGAGCTERKDITEKKDYEPPNKYMYQVVNWMKTYDNKYDLATNNCQVFAIAFYEWI